MNDPRITRMVHWAHFEAVYQTFMMDRGPFSLLMAFSPNTVVCSLHEVKQCARGLV